MHVSRSGRLLTSFIKERNSCLYEPHEFGSEFDMRREGDSVSFTLGSERISNRRLRTWWTTGRTCGTKQNRSVQYFIYVNRGRVNANFCV